MSKTKRAVTPSPVTSLATEASFGANMLPLDEAPRIQLSGGVEGRQGLCPVEPHHSTVQVHPKRQISKLKRAMAVTGPISPAVIDEHYVILAGHARHEAMKLNGAEHIPVLQVFDLSQAKERLFMLSDNRIGQDSKLDRKALANQLPELTVLFEEAGLAVLDTGFEVAELDELVLDFGDESDPSDDVDDKLLDEPEVLRPGDLVALGEHRLVVGDARDEGCLDRSWAASLPKRLSWM